MKTKYRKHLCLLTALVLGLGFIATSPLRSQAAEPDEPCQALVQLVPKRSNGRVPFTPTDAQIIEILKRLSEITPLNPRAVRRHSPNPEAENAIANVLGKPYGIAKIYNYAIKIKPYKEWIIEAGLDPDVVYKKILAIEPELILKALKALISAGYSVRSGIVNQGYLDNDPKVMEVIVSAIDRRIEPSHLHYYATGTYKKTWDKWLIEAGMDPTEARTW